MEPSYVCTKVLKGLDSEPVNFMLFSENAKYLLVAGDDRKVRVWNTETFQCEQVLESVNWGQVTCLTWIYQETATNENFTILCVGNGRGSLSLFPMDSREVKPFSKPATFFTPFRFNDSVEKLTFDKLNQRLAVASHSGELKMYKVDLSIASAPFLRLLWEGSIGEAVIPTALVFFGGAKQSLLTGGLENSELCCRDADNNTVLWKKKMQGGGIGCAALSSDETLFLVYNLLTGHFDVYNVSDQALLRSLPLGSQRRFIKQCLFFEGSKYAICGSDTNKVHVVDVINNFIVQTLTTGKEGEMSQIVTVTPASSRRGIIAGACRGSVYIWEKETGRRYSNRRTSIFRRLVRGFFDYDMHLCLLILIVTFGAWYPYCRKVIADLTGTPLWSNSFGMPVRDGENDAPVIYL